MNDVDYGNKEITLVPAVLIIFLCGLFGANGVAIKISLTGFGVFTTLGLRFTIAAVAIFIWARATGRPIRLKRGQLPQLLVITLIFIVQLSLFYLGLHKTYAARGALISNVFPFLVLILAHFFIPDDPMTKRKLIGICLGFLGVLLIFIEKEGITDQLKVGDFYVLLATTIWACGTIYVKRIIKDFQPYQISLYSMVFSVPIFFLEAFLWDKQFILKLNTGVFLALIYQSLLIAGFGFVTWNYLLKKHGATALNSFIFIMPMAGVFSGGMILNEPISPYILAALMFVAVGMTIIHLKTIKLPPFIISGNRF
jgi:drug/metabolite transporter (DMT)-like permease